VNSNDPNTPVFKLELTAMVKVEVDVNPTTVNFRELLPGEKKTETVEVVNLSDNLLKINSITSPYDFVSIDLAGLKLPLSLKQNEKATFKVSVDAASMKERTWGQVIISTDNPHTPQVTLYVTGRVLSENQNSMGSHQQGSAQTFLPQITYSDRARKLFPLYNFVAGNVVQNLAGCNSSQCLPMKALIQVLVTQNFPDEKITEAVRQIYGPAAVAASTSNSPQPPRPSLREAIQNALKDGKKAKLDLFAMSYCPFALRAEKALDKIMAELGSKIDLQIYFIAQSKTEGSDKLADSFASLHGLPEVEEDLRQVLIQKYFPEKLFSYLRLRNENIKTTDWRECAKKAGVDLKKLEELIASKSSLQLFRENLAKAQTMNIHASPTLFINNVRYQGGFQ